MTEFSHSEVLFAGKDGLPIQFNIQNTTEKKCLKALIEHGGGLCAFSDEAYILVSPGTKVLTIHANKNLISSRYIFDCVKDDYLLDTEEYRIEISEMEASAFSDSSNLLASSVILESSKKLHDPNLIDTSIDIVQPPKIFSPNNICHNNNHDFDFQDNETHNTLVGTYDDDINNEQENSHHEFSLESTEKHSHVDMHIDKLDNLQSIAKAVTLGNFEQPVSVKQKDVVSKHVSSIENPVVSSNDDPVKAIVSSSQENLNFLNQVNNKVEEKPTVDDDSLSQSNTVSSSADAQISPNEPPSHHTSAEIFSGNSAAPDSASQTTERQRYIKNLEKEIEQILQKPSPKSIQDKIILVKYVSAVKKLAPAVVLRALQNF